MRKFLGNILLYQTQQKDILHLGNKLKSQHFKWQNHKMKVKFATQLFSHSVSAAITSNLWRADVLLLSGFVAKNILESIDCPECTAALYNNSDTSISYVHTGAKSLLTCKKYGNLLLPSYSVYKVMTCLDKLARRSLCKWSSFNKQDKLAIAMSVLKETRNTTFLSIQNHSMETHILDNNLRDDRVTFIIKEIVQHYLTLFFHQFSRVYTERMIKNNKASRRIRLTKTILFYNE